MDKTTNAINWFEIPVIDMGRAKKFYESIFNIEMKEVSMGDDLMAIFPREDNSEKIAGALIKSPHHKPAKEGTVVYLNANPKLDDIIARVKDAGGQVAVEKMTVCEHGHIAFIIDTEGNRVGVHSEK